MSELSSQDASWTCDECGGKGHVRGKNGKTACFSDYGEVFNSAE